MAEVTDDEIMSAVSKGKAYHLVFLKAGPNRDRPEDEANALQMQHLRHLFTLKRDGRLCIFGPLTDDGDLRGIAIYSVTDYDEVKALVDADPAVKAGVLAYEIHPWFGIPGQALT